jgi:hypothetical protein
MVFNCHKFSFFSFVNWLLTALKQNEQIKGVARYGQGGAAAPPLEERSDNAHELTNYGINFGRIKV